MVKTTRGLPEALSQMLSTDESGATFVLTCRFSILTASKTFLIVWSNLGIGTLPRPLPINWIVEERSTELGISIISCRLDAPQFTKRTEWPSLTDCLSPIFEYSMDDSLKIELAFEIGY